MDVLLIYLERPFLTIKDNPSNKNSNHPLVIRKGAVSVTSPHVI